MVLGSAVLHLSEQKDRTESFQTLILSFDLLWTKLKTHGRLFFQNTQEAMPLGVMYRKLLEMIGWKLISYSVPWHPYIG